LAVVDFTYSFIQNVFAGQVACWCSSRIICLAYKRLGVWLLPAF
jgi:hypothetical protein